MIKFKTFINQVRPRFLERHTQKKNYQALFSYRYVWFISLFLLIIASLAPMSLFLLGNYNMAHKAIKTENRLRTLRLTSNVRRTITYFLEERLDALKFLMQKEEFERLKNLTFLSNILTNLKMGFGGFVDIGLMDDSGVQIRYAGPFDLHGREYGDQEWFKRCVENGKYVSDVFLGYRKVPHMIIAVRSLTKDGFFYILRATLDIKKFIQILSSLELSNKSDAFICNREGLLQTPSKYYGKLLERMDLSVSAFSTHSQVYEAVDNAGNPILIGYAYIKNSPYILMLIKRTEEIMKGWYSLRNKMILFFCVSVIVILIVILGVSTYMVNKVHDAEQTRAQVMEQIEHASRLASVGRLAAGVAHEINNPLAIINENAGLIKDLFTLKKEYKGDQRLMGLMNDVLESVERCGKITKNLLGFARQTRFKIEPIRLNNVIREVLMFLGKEASYRNISLNMDLPAGTPEIYSDHGKLQQIFLNLINNAFQAMNDGGRLDISVLQRDEEHVSVSIRDNGCGIPDEERKNLFEPFFSTKIKDGGTGLGLAITYGLVKSLRGDISVQSKVGEGTTFVITFPVKPEEDVKDESSAG